MFRKIIPIMQVLVFGLFLVIPSSLYSKGMGYKYLKNYSNIDYDHLPQNFGMVQSKNGIIYIANQGGVLECDGVSWRIIGIPEYATARSIAIDKAGTIYVGGIGEFGYLAPGEKGSLVYNSLLSYLPNEQRNFTGVWKTYTVGKYVYFDSSEHLFQWDTIAKKMTVLPRAYKSFLRCGEDLFIRGGETGLERVVQIEDTELKTKPMPGGKEFSDKVVYMIAPYEKEKLLIGTAQDGLYTYDGKATTPFPTEVDDYLKEKMLIHGIRLTSGDFALATFRGGLVIMDPHGGLKHIFDKSYGLLDDTVYCVFEDNSGNLWLCLSNGISKVEYASPISIYDDRSGLSGFLLSVTRHQDDLYVGTSTGLYALESSSSKFSRRPGIATECWGLCSSENSLLAATSAGVFDLKKNLIRNVIKDRSFILVPSSQNTGRIWCGTQNGLVALSRENDGWTEKYRVKDIKQEIHGISEDQKGNLWLVTVTGIVFMLDFTDNTREPEITSYDRSHGLPEGEIYISRAANHVLFATNKGLYRFDDKSKRFIPDETLGAQFAGGSNASPVFRIVEDKYKVIWFHSESRNYLAVPEEGGTFSIISRPFLRIPPAFQVNAIYPDPDGKTIWFGSQGGSLIHYDTTVEKNCRQDFQTLVRKVFVNEMPIFNGCKNETGNTPKDMYPVLEYKDRNLRFEFAAPFFEAETDTQYQCLLEGYNDIWSSFNRETKKDYTNLDNGLYTFRVRAKNIYEQTSSEGVFRFKILPPWYKTWWAYVIYGIGIFLLMFFIVKMRSRRLEHEKEKLELIVKKRTKEIEEKNEQLETQTHKLEDQSEKLLEMDKVKSRFFANISHEFRTPLTLIMGPIEQMLSENRQKKQKSTLNVMLRSSQRLLNLINRLLDLSRFDSGKMKLHATRQNIVPFIRGISASFDMLAHHNELELKFQCEEEEISLYFDAPKMEEVIYNLLSNAVKFTPAGGKITVSVSREGEPPEVVKIAVRDTGIGINKEQFDHIFDRFFQAGYLKEKGHKGTGIGLALVKEIITLHHGQIDVHSREGKGTEFVIKLLMGKGHLKPDEITASPGTESDHKKDKDIAVLYSKIEEVDTDEGQEDQTEEIGPDGKLEDDTVKNEKNVILVVEDHADVRKYIRDPLESQYNIVEACDGKEGIEKAKEIIPDLIVSDIMMPKTDGYQLCRELKRDIKTSHIPIILITAKASEESIIKGLETGADDYITKPFNTKMLGFRIKNLIDLRRQMQLTIQRRKSLLPPTISVSSIDDKFLEEFQAIVKKNLKDPEFNIDTLCEKLYMGRSTLFRKIQALTGETPNQFILTYRLELAAQLLKAKFGNVTDVAFEVGFSSTAYFSKCFKEKFHQSPSSFLASESSVTTKE